MKVQVNKSNSRSYAHNYRITNSTTCDFGFVQPLFMRQLFNSSSKGKVSIKGSLGQFMRLAPMPFPTFGEVKLDTLAVGVPIEQVYPAWASFLSGKDYQYGQTAAYYPTKLPFVTNQELTRFLYGNLAISKTYANSQIQSSVAKVASKVMSVSEKSDTSDISFDFSNLSLIPFDVFAIECQKVYEENSGVLPSIYHVFKSDTYGEVVISLPTMAIYFDYFDGKISKSYAQSLLGYSTSNNVVPRKSASANVQFTLEQVYAAVQNADYVELSPNGFTCYTLSSKGKALRKTLIGLGYNLSMDDKTEMSILPLLACYKAYFDNFFPNRGIDWNATLCHQLINEIQVGGTSDIVKDDNSLLMFTSFMMQELSAMYSTHAMDFISLHTNNASNGNNPFKENVGIVNSYESGISWQQEASYKPDLSGSSNTANPVTTEGTVGAHPIIPKDRDITSWSIQFVLALQKYVNKDSIIGNRVKTWLKSHLNQDVFNSIYNTADFVSRNSIDVAISDINCNASTDGAELGSYAGKGIASGNNMSFFYECSTASIFIIFAYISPTTGYYQGSDCTLAMLDKWSMPTSEFDALGYELTPRSVLFTDNGISCSRYYPDGQSVDLNNFVCSNNDGFGFMPRYSVWKYAKNIVNGDMSLRSKRNTYKAFYLDRELVLRYPVIELKNPSDPNNDAKAIHIKINKSPLASSAWQYISRYDYLSNYNRIFYNAGNETSSTQNVDDNFILHNVIDFTEINSLKPLSISYDVEDGAPMDIEKA